MKYINCFSVYVGKDGKISFCNIGMTNSYVKGQEEVVDELREGVYDLIKIADSKIKRIVKKESNE